MAKMAISCESRRQSSRETKFNFAQIEKIWQIRAFRTETLIVGVRV